MIFGSGFIQQLHPCFDVLFNLQFFLFKILLEQFRAVFDQQVSVEQIGFTAMSDFYDLKSPFDLSFEVTALLESSQTVLLCFFAVPDQFQLRALDLGTFMQLLPLV